jgi:phage shock protein PspC (stress-responsive transcriptional regulator)
MDTGLSRGPRRLYRSTRERMVSGVAAGLADYVGIDATAVRLLWIVAAFVTGPVAPLLYMAAWWLIPREDELTPIA